MDAGLQPKRMLTTQVKLSTSLPQSSSPPPLLPAWGSSDSRPIVESDATPSSATTLPLLKEAKIGKKDNITDKDQQSQIVGEKTEGVATPNGKRKRVENDLDDEEIEEMLVSSYLG